MKLKIINIKNGLSKSIDISNYSLEEFMKTYLVYEGSGNFMIKVIR